MTRFAAVYRRWRGIDIGWTIHENLGDEIPDWLPIYVVPPDYGATEEEVVARYIEEENR
jgi:hypothetical protein